MIKTEMIWHDAKDEIPECNGKYIMLTKYGLVDTILYAEGKWNAFIDEDGKLGVSAGRVQLAASACKAAPEKLSGPAAAEMVVSA